MTTTTLIINWFWLALLGLVVLGGGAVCVACRKKGGRVRLACTIAGGVCAMGIVLCLMLTGRFAPPPPSVISMMTDTGSEVVHIDIDEKLSVDSRFPAESPRVPDSVRINWKSSEHSQDSFEPWVVTAFSGAAMLILVVLAWLFLDAGRRGGYAWPIRITAAIVFGGLCLCLWEIGPLM